MVARWIIRPTHNWFRVTDAGTDADEDDDNDIDDTADVWDLLIYEAIAFGR